MGADQVQFTDEEQEAIFAECAKKWECTVKELKRDGTLLHCAASLGKIEVVKSLVESGEDVNVREKFSFTTPLHQAALEGHVEVIEYLITVGAEVNARDCDGKTPFELAEQSEIEYILSTLDSEVF